MVNFQFALYFESISYKVPRSAFRRLLNRTRDHDATFGGGGCERARYFFKSVGHHS